MGVIGKGYNPFSVGFIEDYIDHELVVDDDVDGNEDGDDDVDRRATQTSNSRRNRRIKLRSPAKPMDFSKCGKFSGAKKNRRYENNIQLGMCERAAHCNANYIEEVDEVSILDFIPVRVSAFAQLLNDCENMPFWNEFINCTDCDRSEDRAGRQRRKRQNNSTVNRECCISDVNVDIDEDDEDERNKGDYPTYDPEDSFGRISGRFRTLLKEKRLSMGALQDLEDKLISFFLEWPRKVYISKLPSTYHRLLLHSLCQYLDLISRSYNSDGDRQTRVQNPYKNFQLPNMLLSEYIEKRYKM